MFKLHLYIFLFSPFFLPLLIYAAQRDDLPTVTPGHVLQARLEKYDYEVFYNFISIKIANRENLNAPEKGIGTPLQRTCGKGDSCLHMTQLLLANGADPNLTHDETYPPLHKAVFNNALETVKLLVAAGAKCNSTNMWNMTPLECIDWQACDEESDLKKRIQITRILLKHGSHTANSIKIYNECLYQTITPNRWMNFIIRYKGKQVLLFKHRKALTRMLLEHGASLNDVGYKTSPIKECVKSCHRNTEYQLILLELAHYALSYSNYLRARLLSILGHSGTPKKHETPFRALSKDLVTHITKFIYPPYLGLTFIPFHPLQTTEPETMGVNQDD